MSCCTLEAELIQPTLTAELNAGLPGINGGYISPALTAVVDGTTFEIPAGKRLFGFGINKASGARIFTVGTTANGIDVVENKDVASNTDDDIFTTLYTSTGITLHFSGFIGSIRIYLL